MGLIRHMATWTKNNRRLARFYYFVFGMEEVWNEVQNSPYSFYIGDGYFQLNCLLMRYGAKDPLDAKFVDGKEILPDVGFDHIGFQVKSIKEAEKRFAEVKPPIKLELSPKDGRYEESRFTDPDGNRFELAEGEWDPGKRHDGMSAVRYVGINSDNPDRLAEFYKFTLAMKEINRSSSPDTGIKTIYLSDGKMCFAVEKGVKGVKNGLTTIGFKVQNVANIKDRIKNSPSFQYPGEPPIEIVQRPASSVYKAFYLKDPDGNMVELSEEGWGA